MTEAPSFNGVLRQVGAGDGGAAVSLSVLMKVDRDNAAVIVVLS